MAELYFRKGTMADLANADILNGSINITTDEPAIYLDIDNERKRIGDVIVVNTLNDLMPKFEGSEDLNWGEANPQYVNHWSTTALYYVTDANALLKWTGDEWKQINSGEGGNQIDLSEIQSQINGLKGRVDTIESNLANLVPQVGELTTNVNDYVERVETLEDTVSGDSGLSSAVSGHETKINSLTTNVSNNTTAIGLLQTAVAEKVDKNVYDLLSNDVKTVKEIVDNKADKTEVEANSTSINTLKGNVQSLSGQSADHATRISTAESAIATLSESVAVKVEQEDFDKLNETVNGHSSTIQEQSQLIATKADQSMVDTINQTVGEHNTRLAAVENNVSTKAEQTYVDGIKEELIDKIISDINAANAMEYKKSIDSSNELPQARVKIGDTYIASKNFLSTDARPEVRVGDLLIATVIEGKEEIEGFIPVEDIVWEHIPTGYSSQLDPSLIADGTSIVLKAFNDANMGTVRITGNNNIVVENANNDNEIKVSLVWGSF